MSPRVEDGEAMVIAPTSAVHTWFMKSAADVARDDVLEVVEF